MFKHFFITFYCLLGLSCMSFGQVFPAKALHLAGYGNDFPYIYHNVQPKETLYQLSKQYNSNVSVIQALNRLTSNKLSLNQVLKMPIDPERLTYFIPNENSDDWIVLYYEVKRKDNLYKICKRGLGLNLTVIKEINNLSSNKLRLGQKILLGYYPLFNSKKEDEIPVVINKPDIVIPTKPRSIIDTVQLQPTSVMVKEEDEKRKLVQSDFNGVAYWNKESTHISGTYVLSNTIPSGRKITIFNPMGGYEIEAKVIGRIPENMYEGDILVLVSNSVAKKLGALDSRFYVKVRYLSPVPITTKAD